MDLEKELKEIQIQYDKVCHERNELEKENRLLKKDLKEYQEYIKKGVEEHYKDFMSDYDVLLEEYHELINANEKLKKQQEVLEILKKYLYYDNKNHFIKMKPFRKSIYNFDYEDLKEWLEND